MKKIIHILFIIIEYLFFFYVSSHAFFLSLFFAFILSIPLIIILIYSLIQFFKKQYIGLILTVITIFIIPLSINNGTQYGKLQNRIIKDNLKPFINALEIYKEEFGYYPKDLFDLYPRYKIDNEILEKIIIYKPDDNFDNYLLSINAFREGLVYSSEVMKWFGNAGDPPATVRFGLNHDRIKQFNRCEYEKEICIYSCNNENDDMNNTSCIKKCKKNKYHCNRI